MATALVLLYPGCTVAEIALTADRLSRLGHTVRWWTLDGAPIVDTAGLRISPGLGIEPDIESAAAGADLMLVPGGDPEPIMGNEAIAAALRSADARGATVAAICAGVLVLADAGLTAGRRITHNYRRPLAPAEVEDFTRAFWADAQVEPDLDQGVVVDGNLITALPTAVTEFAETVTERFRREDRRDRDGS